MPLPLVLLDGSCTVTGHDGALEGGLGRAGTNRTRLGTSALPASVGDLVGRLRALGGRVNAAYENEIKFFSLRLWIATSICSLVPAEACRARSTVLRGLGIPIGDNTRFDGSVRMEGARSPGDRLTIGAGCRIGAGVLFDLGDCIAIGNDVHIADDVAFITTSHEIGPGTQRAGMNISSPIVIGDRCTIGTRATILRGISVGVGSTVAAGSVVTKDVPPNTTVSGIPARPDASTP